MKDNYSRKNNYSNKSSLGNEHKGNGNICKYIAKCGACRYSQDNYDYQCEQKNKEVNKNIGGFCHLEPFIGMKDPFFYRNKVHDVICRDKKGNVFGGIYAEGTHDIVIVDKCMIEDKRAEKITASICNLIKSFKMKVYNEDSEFGLFRHILIRTGHNSNQIMLVLVTASVILPSKNNFVKAIMKENPEITTIVQNINEKRTNMILGDRDIVLYGKGYIEDTLCGKTFRISPRSFYQINPVQTEILYRKAIQYAELTGNETVIDAYCGIGTIGLVASDCAGKIIGVESNRDAVRDANINKKLNDARNAEYYTADAGEFMQKMTANGESVDVVFMDPPRAGSDETFLNAVVKLAPKRIVYISCNPITMKRDLDILTKKGYKAEKGVGVDMFPWTSHVETVVALHRTNS